MTTPTFAVDLDMVQLSQTDEIGFSTLNTIFSYLYRHAENVALGCSTVVVCSLPGETGGIGPIGPGVAIGGTTGQILAKSSNTNYETVWINDSSADLLNRLKGGTIGTIFYKKSSDDYDFEWKTPAEVISGFIPTHGIPLNQSSAYDMSIIYCSASKQITLTPAIQYGTYDYWMNGVYSTCTNTDKTAFSLDTAGLQYAYICSGGSLLVSLTQPDLSTNVLVGTIARTNNTDGSCSNIFTSLQHTPAMLSADWKLSTDVIGLYPINGFTATDYILNSCSATDIIPSVIAGTTATGDLQKSIPAKLKTDLYTTAFLDADGNVQYNLSQPFPFIYCASETYPQINVYSGGSWTLQQVCANKFFNVWHVVIPSINCEYTHVFLSGQAEHSELSAAIYENPADLIRGTLDYNSDYMFINAFTYYSGCSYQCSVLTCATRGSTLVSARQVYATKLERKYQRAPLPFYASLPLNTCDTASAGSSLDYSVSKGTHQHPHPTRVIDEKATAGFLGFWTGTASDLVTLDAGAGRTDNVLYFVIA